MALCCDHLISSFTICFPYWAANRFSSSHVALWTMILPLLGSRKPTTLSPGMGLQHSAMTNSGSALGATGFSVGLSPVSSLSSSRSFCGMKSVQNFSSFLVELLFRIFLQVVEPDDSRADLAVELLFVRAAVGRHDLAQYPAAQVDVQPLHAFLEHLYASLDVVLLLALEEAFDGLLGLARGYRVQPLGLGTGIVGRDDFDLVAAVELRSQRFDLVVDLRSDGVVADLGVNLVGEINAVAPKGSLRASPFGVNTTISDVYSDNLKLSRKSIAFSDGEFRAVRIFLSHLSNSSSSCDMVAFLYFQWAANPSRRCPPCAGCGSAPRPIHRRDP